MRISTTAVLIVAFAGAAAIGPALALPADIYQASNLKEDCGETLCTLTLPAAPRGKLIKIAGVSCNVGVPLEVERVAVAMVFDGETSFLTLETRLTIEIGNARSFDASTALPFLMKRPKFFANTGRAENKVSSFACVVTGTLVDE